MCRGCGCFGVVVAVACGAEVFVHERWNGGEESPELVRFAASAGDGEIGRPVFSEYRAKGWSQRGGEMPRFAAIVVGHIRTGRFSVVSQNIDVAVLGPLRRADLFVVCEEGEATNATLGSVVASWTRVRQWHLRDAKSVPPAAGCGITGENRPCWPYQPQHFKLAAAMRMLVEVERATPSVLDTSLTQRYEWVLRLRSDVTYSFALPEAPWWTYERRAVYVDYIWYPRDGDAITGLFRPAVAASECRSVRDVFAMVHRDYAASYFANFAAAYLETGECLAEWGCPPCSDYFRSDAKPLGLVPWWNPDPVLGSVLAMDGRLNSSAGDTLLSAWRKAPVVAMYIRSAIVVCGSPNYPREGAVNSTTVEGKLRLVRQHDPRCDAPFQGHPNLEFAKNIINHSLPVHGLRHAVKTQIEALDFVKLRL